MLLTLVPLFDENMAVCAYSFFTQRENYLLNPLLLRNIRKNRNIGDRYKNLFSLRQ